MFRFIRSFIDRRSEALPASIDARSYDTALGRGDRLAAAREEWPEDRYPTLYRDIPDDMRRPVVWDGKVLGGADVGSLMWRHLTPEIVVEASKQSGYQAVKIALIVAAFLAFTWAQAVLPFKLNFGLATELLSPETSFVAKAMALVAFLTAGFTAGYAFMLAYRAIGGRRPDAFTKSMLAGFAVTYLGGSIGAFGLDMLVGQFAQFGALADLMQARATPAGTEPDLDAFVRYPVWADEIGATAPVYWYYLARTVQVLAVIPGLAGVLVAAALVFVATFYAAWSFGFVKTLNRWAAKTGAPFRVATRDALLLWKAKAAGPRDAEYRAYCRQVEDACGRLASSPLIPVGIATGTTRARGDMKAPVKGQTVAFDGESIRVHTLALGDTGTGKTRDVLRPLFARIMNAVWGDGHKIGAYVTDGKGSLWRDVLPVVAHRQDVRVIGTEEGMYGVDLLAGMSPLEVSATFRSIAGVTSGGGSGDDFWLEMASLLVFHAATVAEAVEFDPETMHGRTARLYSLAGIMTLATDPVVQKELAERVVALNGDLARLKAENRDLFNAVASAYESALWFRQSFAAMADDTRSSVVANVAAVLGKLVGAGALTDRFARGSMGGNEIDVDFALNGGVVLVAIGESEFGTAGKIVSMWLKQRLFVLAKRRLVTDPEACRNTTVAFVADEYQSLATTGSNSDLDFWNVARETGVFFLGATQSVAALNQNIGKEATANLLNLFRNKIVLSTGEVETIDYIRKLAGDLPQGWEPDETFYATQAEREQALPDAPAPVVAALPLPGKLKLEDPSMEAALDLDTRFIGRPSMSPESRLSSSQQANWRYEDKNKEVLTSGLSWQSKIRHDELRHGQGFAFAIIHRAGLDRADILDLRSI